MHLNDPRSRLAPIASSAALALGAPPGAALAGSGAGLAPGPAHGRRRRRRRRRRPPAHKARRVGGRALLDVRPHALRDAAGRHPARVVHAKRQRLRGRRQQPVRLLGQAGASCAPPWLRAGGAGMAPAPRPLVHPPCQPYPPYPTLSTHPATHPIHPLGCCSCPAGGSSS